MTTNNAQDTISVLKEQIDLFKSRLEPHDTGHLHTTINTLQHRIKELENKETSVEING